MPRPSVMAHQFSRVPSINIQRSTFDRSHGLKTAIDFDYLYPIYLDEVLPGDTVNLSVNAFGRLATPTYPVLDNMYLDFFFFSVPCRLVWDNWVRLQGEQLNPSDTTDYVVPTVDTPSGGWDLNTIGDYFGLPIDEGGLLNISALPMRGYNLIWNEWFRDQNLQNPVTVNLDDGPDDDTDYTLLKRGKRHDYFTSCLPWPQKDRGNEVLLPLGDTAPVQAQTAGAVPLFDVGGATNKSLASDGSTTGVDWSGAAPGSAGNAAWADPRLVANLTTATSSTVNQLREAIQIQRMQERDARGGTRYVEIIQAHFGVTTPSAGWRTEYLGGGSSRIGVHEVAQTSESTLGDPIGKLGAFGTVGVSGNGFTKSFTEHCFVIGLACARADINYQQGIDRLWTRSTRYDFYYPSLAHLGEQAVLTGEIYARGGVDDQVVFGYQERFAEYRYKPSKVTGIMRSQAAGSLDAWHLAQDFASLPTLNSTFIEQNTPVDRVIDTPDDPHLLLDCYFNLRHARPMPVYSVPGFMDHF